MSPAFLCYILYWRLEQDFSTEVLRVAGEQGGFGIAGATKLGLLRPNSPSENQGAIDKKFSAYKFGEQ